MSFPVLPCSIRSISESHVFGFSAFSSNLIYKLCVHLICWRFVCFNLFLVMILISILRVSIHFRFDLRFLGFLE